MVERDIVKSTRGRWVVKRDFIKMLEMRCSGSETLHKNVPQFTGDELFIMAYCF